MKSSVVARLWRLALVMAVLVSLVLSGKMTVSAGGSKLLVDEVIPEGHDFASVVLNDAWDMNQYSDVSQNINSDGQFNYLTNINVSNGIFSATAVDGMGGEGFYVLFPRHHDTLASGKVGERFPINTAKYQCLYLAMRVESRAGTSQYGPDQFKVYWFADASLTGNQWGRHAQVIYDLNFDQPVHYWKLFKVNLASASGTFNVPWMNRANWQGLRIDPTNQSNIPFAIDWVRLTDCSPSTVALSWSSAGAGSVYSLWAKRQGTSHYIRVAADLNTTSTNLDMQGMEPGTYDLFVSTAKDSCCTAPVSTVTVSRAPVAKFSKPSFTSGVSYQAVGGVEWDMDGSTDVDRVDCAAAQFSNGKLILDTPTFAAQPAECRGGDVSDPKIFLRSPAAVNTHEYRYLTFHMLGENEPGKNWQEYGLGMMIRWIWGSNGCYLVSNAVAYDVGWNTYTVDLWDARGGASVSQVGNCPANMDTWLESGTASEFRFDPNENISGHNFHQEIDWIKLTKTDEVRAGQVFPVGVTLNHTNNNARYTLYYTTDPVGAPKQHLANVVEPGPGPTPVPGMKHIYLPSVSYGPASTTPAGKLWDTAGVPAGTYYICAEAWDDINTAPAWSNITCSEAPVKVVQ